MRFVIFTQKKTILEHKFYRTVHITQTVWIWKYILSWDCFPHESNPSLEWILYAVCKWFLFPGNICMYTNFQGVIDSTEADIFMPFFSLNTRWSLKIFTLFSWFKLIWSNKSNFVYGMVKCFKDSSKRFATTDLNCTWLRGVNDTWHWRDRTVELLIGISPQ